MQRGTDLVRSHHLMDSKSLATKLNPAMESIMVCVVEMGSAKKFDTTIVNKALVSAVSQVEGNRAGQGSQARCCTLSVTWLTGRPMARSKVSAKSTRTVSLCVSVVVDGW